MAKKKSKPYSKPAACREHSCDKARGAKGYCGEHQDKWRRHHDKKLPRPPVEE